jgi:ankyrin repeat protein
MKSGKLKVTFSILTACALAMGGNSKAPAQKPDSQQLFNAVREGDTAKVRKLLGRGADAKAVDSNGIPAVMIAALYADAQMVKALLDAGADPNAKNVDDATALIWAAGDPAKVEVLLAKGANVNVQSKQHRTPLHTAAAQDGAFESLKLLVEKGADVNAADGVPNFSTGGIGTTPLMLAVRGRDPRSTRYLLAHGAKVNQADSSGGTALLSAARQGCVENVKALLAAGADPNATVKEFPFKGFGALGWAAAMDRGEAVEALIAAGADVNQKDGLGYTPLVWASMSERGDATTVKMLLAAGADPNVKGAFGETAASWAAKKGATPIAAALAADARPAVVAMIAAAGGSNEAPSAAALRAAIEKSVAVMQPSGPKFFKVSGCVSCHNNTLPVSAAQMALQRGIPANKANIEQQVQAVKAMLNPAAEVLRQATDAVPDPQVVAGYVLMSLASLDYPADEMTTAIVHNVATKQLEDGSWPNFAPRPPIENGDIQATVMGIRALQLYAPAGRHDEFERRIEHAREWLRKAQPKTTEESLMMLWGLEWSGAKAEEVKSAGRAILAMQRADGGWAQLETLGADAYATGKTLVVLRETGVLQPSDAAYQRGVHYLLNTQKEDGSWVVKSRSFPFQPLKESGFPHGRDQWISAAATAWASMALSYGLDAVDTRLAAR